MVQERAVSPGPRTSIQIRVRYAECDPQRVAHHSVYAVWLEAARTELLREQGVAYAELEAKGIYFVVARMSFRFHRPALYDDVLRVEVEVKRSGGVKIEHTYAIWRDEQLLARAETTLACVDGHGKLRPVVEALSSD